MYTYSQLSQLSSENLTNLAESLGLDHLDSSHHLRINAILNIQYCIIREHLSTNIRNRQEYATQLTQIANNIKCNLSVLEQQLIITEHKPSDPILAVTESECKKVALALELIKQASQLLADCSVNYNNYHEYINR